MGAMWNWTIEPAYPFASALTILYSVAFQPYIETLCPSCVTVAFCQCDLRVCADVPLAVRNDWKALGSVSWTDEYRGASSLPPG